MDQQTTDRTDNQPTPKQNDTRLEIVEIDRMVAEAEERGYLRGRNEAANSLLNSPKLLENTSLHESEKQSGDSFAARFLSQIPRGVWD